jgi:hypothetical protein
VKISDEHRTTAYQILNDPVRRFVLSYLNGQAEDVPIERLANDYTTHAHQHATNESTKRLRMRLHHVHLPYLADAGLIEYDHDTHRITDWRHPNLNDQWLTQTPVEPLAETIVSVQHARE